MGRREKPGCEEADDDREAHEWTLRRGAADRGPAMLIEDAVREIRKSYTPVFAARVCGKLEKALEMVRKLEDAARRRNVGAENSGI